jgi:hypothetical protein
MLDRYVGRTLAGNALACIRSRIRRRATHGSRYVSFHAVQMPRLAPTQRAFRITFYPPYSEALWEEDAVFLARGRTLAVVSAASPISASDRSAKLAYFRRIAERIPHDRQGIAEFDRLDHRVPAGLGESHHHMSADVARAVRSKRLRGERLEQYDPRERVVCSAHAATGTTRADCRGARVERHGERVAVGRSAWQP